jgi:hypothetical protein
MCMHGIHGTQFVSLITTQNHFVGMGYGGKPSAPPRVWSLLLVEAASREVDIWDEASQNPEMGCLSFL